MAFSLADIKVLIVEDDQDIREIYATTFMKKGFTVFTATDGRGAIQKYQNKEPDIILLDIMMPNVDGYQVLKEVRKNMKKYTPVIMLTNLDATLFEERAEFGDVDAYLIKSHYSPSEILAKVVEVMKLNKLIPAESDL